jgi:hypothetical protein
MTIEVPPAFQGIPVDSLVQMFDMGPREDGAPGSEGWWTDPAGQTYYAQQVGEEFYIIDL